MYDIIFIMLAFLSVPGIIAIAWIGAKIWVASQILNHPELSKGKVKSLTEMFSKDIRWKCK